MASAFHLSSLKLKNFAYNKTCLLKQRPEGSNNKTRSGKCIVISSLFTECVSIDCNKTKIIRESEKNYHKQPVRTQVKNEQTSEAQIDPNIQLKIALCIVVCLSNSFRKFVSKLEHDQGKLLSFNEFVLQFLSIVASAQTACKILLLCDSKPEIVPKISL